MLEGASEKGRYIHILSLATTSNPSNESTVLHDTCPIYAKQNR